MWKSPGVLLLGGEGPGTGEMQQMRDWVALNRQGIVCHQAIDGIV